MRNNWKTKKLDEIGVIFNGNSINSKIKKEKYLNLEKGFPFIATKDVNFNTNFINYDNGVKIPYSEKSFKIAHKNSVLICSEGGSAGKKIAFNEKDVCFGNKLFAIETKNDVDSKFVFYWYLTPKFSNDFKDQMNGIIGGISIRNFKNLQIPVPSLSEQCRIVKILDEAFKKIALAKKNAEKNLQNTHKLFESYLQKVFDNSGKSWEKKKLDEICNRITDGTHITPTYVSEGIPFLSVKNLTKGFIDFSNTRFISPKEHKFLTKNVYPERNDILYTKVGTTGVAQVVDVDIEFSIFVSLALLKIKHDIIFNRYLEYFLNSPFAKQQAQKRTRGMANKNLVISDIKEIEIHFPKLLSKQKSIVKKLDTLSAETKKLEKIYQQKLSDLEELKKSVLQKAFNGDL